MNMKIEHTDLVIILTTIGEVLDKVKEQTGISLNAKLQNKDINFYIEEMQKIEIVPFSLFELEEAVLSVFNIKSHTLRSKCRQRALVDARAIFTAIARKYRFTFLSIAKHMKRDHTTAIHHVRKSDNLLQTDPVYKERYYRVLNHIKEKYAAPIQTDY